MSLSNRQANSVGDTGAQRAGGYLNAGGFKGLGVARGFGASLAELLDVFDRDRVVAGQVQQGVKQHAAVAR